jgi:hypothetical protein
MFSDIMMTWLTPSMRPGRAAGSSTRQSICRPLQPAMRPNSTISGGTLCSASKVTRTIGGKA